MDMVLLMIPMLLYTEGSLSLSGLAVLLIKWVILAAIFFALKWFAGWLGANVPEFAWKVLAALLVLLGAYFLFLYLGL